MLRDATTGNWIGTFSGHKGAVWSCKFDPAGYLAGTASGDFSVRVWDAITGKSLYNFTHKHVVKTLDWSYDSKKLATGGHEGILRIYDISKPNDDPLEFVQSTKEVRFNYIHSYTYICYILFYGCFQKSLTSPLSLFSIQCVWYMMMILYICWSRKYPSQNVYG